MESAIQKREQSSPSHHSGCLHFRFGSSGSRVLRTCSGHPLDVEGVLVKTKTIGKKYRCDSLGCVNYGHVWTVHPLQVKAIEFVQTQLRVWLDVECDGCGEKPTFLGYVEKDVSE